MTEMGEKKQLVVNMTAALVTFGVQAGINFVLTPFITAELGAEAYGFVNLSNTLVNYIAILTVAITSMASRFISLAIFRNDINSASKYYSSTLATLLVCVAVVALPSIVCIISIDSLLNISAVLVGDVKLLMIFVLANFSLSLMSSNLSIGFYVRNKLYIGSLINAVGYLIRGLIMIVLFLFLPTNVAIVGFSAFAATSFVQLLYLKWKKKLLPSMKFNPSDIEPKRIVEVAKAGAWNSVSQLGTTLSSGLDLVVCNLLIGASAMGTLAVSRVIRSAIDSIGSATMSVFQPTLTKYYAQDDIDGLISYAKWAMKSFGLVISLPVGAFIAFGVPFFHLWVPSQDASVLYPLAALSIIAWAVLGPAAIIQNIFTVLNRIKVNSIMLCVGGFSIVLVEYFLLRVTGWGILVIEATTCIESFVRNLFYTIPAGGRYLGKSWTTFFPSVAESLLCVVVVAACGCIIQFIVGIPMTWIGLITEGFASVIFGAFVCLMLLFGSEERSRLLSVVFRKAGR